MAYERLAKNYIWFFKSQNGPVRNTFRWRSAKGNHTLASGLDDYPRAPIRSDLEEHVDLLCWKIMASNTMDRVTKALDIYETPQFKAIEEELIQTLQGPVIVNYRILRIDTNIVISFGISERYWNEKRQTYCDYDGLKSLFWRISSNYRSFCTYLPIL
jgi:mannosyl-oligosaccharide glucosidase